MPAEIIMSEIKRPSVYISYCWDDAANEKISKIIDYLVSLDRFDVIFIDGKQAQISEALHSKMLNRVEEAVRRASIVVVLQSEACRRNKSCCREVDMAIEHKRMYKNKHLVDVDVDSITNGCGSKDLTALLRQLQALEINGF